MVEKKRTRKPNLMYKKACMSCHTTQHVRKGERHCPKCGGALRS